ncbi:methionyl aminopeptidase [Phanerochaete sordida]|uniref:Methionine aminopeptidase n=1 Tax=Phanerochaete sordida TaxID=48140 RepID=A0A9P3LB70_9APHY|nr:methionyl aminopeptidase [Phanerochaete sordida]
MEPSSEAEEDDDILRLEDDGEYEVVVPKDPYARPIFPPPLPVPPHIARPSYATPGYHGRRPFLETFSGDGRFVLGSEDEMKLRRAARLARRVLTYAGSLVSPGVTTEGIDAKVHEFIIRHNAYPSPLQYSGFPKSCCTSVNNVIAHGIPDARPLKDGDIVNIDITVFLDGYHGDTSRTFLVGDVDDIGRDLVRVSEEALEAGIRACGPGQLYRGIAKAIHEVVEDRGYVVCPAFTGHGIGTVFHRPPWIFHDLNEEPGRMSPGQCFTIEPAIIKGANKDHMIFGDDWTASTTNLARSAQAEHMILVTDTGAEVLTQDESTPDA